MNAQNASTHSYDVFKLVVAVILLVIILFLLLRPAQPVVQASVPETMATTATQSLPTQTAVPASATPAPTSMPQSTPTTLPTNTPEAETQITAHVDKAALCILAAPSRLKVGDKVKVLSNLNMRSEAGLQSSIVLTHAALTELEVVGGPVCEESGSGAYLWWQVKRADGTTGWSAEARLDRRSYFMQPLP